MSTAKINIKNIDYFKFKKMVMDGNRDDYAVCSKEVKALCDAVQTLCFRDEEFDEHSDKARFDEITSYYRQILASKRIESLDMRLKSGWWGGAGGGTSDKGGGYSAGKIKPAALVDTLAVKTREWTKRHEIPGQDKSTNGSSADLDKTAEKIEGPGLFVFKHREHQCFQYVGRADNVFARCTELLKGAYEGSMTSDPLTALFVISMATDWDFYFLPVSASDDEIHLHTQENDLLLKHDSIWPHGLNFSLQINSLFEVSEFRKSCIRHHWPPEKADISSAPKGHPELDLTKLRARVPSATASPSRAVSTKRDPVAGVSKRNESRSESHNGRLTGNATPSSTLNDPKTTPTRSVPKHDVLSAAASSTTSRTASTSSSVSQKPSSIPVGKPAAALSAVQTKAMRSKSPIVPKVDPTVSISPTDGNRHSDVMNSTVNYSSDKEIVSPASEEEEDLKPVGTLKRSNTFTFSDSEDTLEEKT